MLKSLELLKTSKKDLTHQKEIAVLEAKLETKNLVIKKQDELIDVLKKEINRRENTDNVYKVYEI